MVYFGNKKINHLSCIGEVALEKLHWGSFIGEVELEKLHFRSCIGENAMEKLHRRSCISEVASGVGAESMAASMPQGDMAPTSSASISLLMESESAPPPELEDLASLLLSLLWCPLHATSYFYCPPPAMSPLETSPTHPSHNVLFCNACCHVHPLQCLL